MNPADSIPQGVLKMIKPTLFFVGHPRSGTGTLDGYLSGHPDIFMADKELHYFGADLGFNSPNRSLENYLSYFTNGGGYRYAGESSTWYLCSGMAAKEIREFSPEAKIIISLRNPVDWLYSLHSHMVYAAYEDVRNFGQAIDLGKERARGKNIPDNAFPRMGVIYRDLVRYAEQVERFQKSFGSENVLVNIFDELKSDPEKLLDQTLEFLDLPTDFPAKSQVLDGTKRKRNANHTHRSKRLHRWIKSPPRRSILQGVIPSPVPGYRLALRVLHKANTRTAERTRMPIEIRAKLAQDFLPEIEKLERHLDRNLSFWKSPSE
jgi:hypothetical protein